MSGKSGLQTAALKVALDPRLRKTRRFAAEARRRLTFRPHLIEVFLQLARQSEKWQVKPGERALLRRIARHVLAFMEEHLTREPVTPTLELTCRPPKVCRIGETFEVTYEIDANGIINVYAKDLATGKARSIRITGFR